MAYKLTLTESERAAFDWVGGRYSNVDDMRKIIQKYPVNPNDSWDSVGLVAFDLPEHAAWEIQMLAWDDDELFSCFNVPLKRKMITFCDSII